MAERMKCLVCENGELVPQESRRTVEIDGASVEVPYRSHSCNECGTVQGAEGDLRFNARAMRKATKEQRKLLTGDEMRERRQRLCLTQEQAAQLFGGGPVAFSKYENDEVAQSEAMDRLVRLAAQYPWLVAALADHVGVTLPEEASWILETFGTTYKVEYLALAKARVRSFRTVFQGFAELGHASNDEQIYCPKMEARTALRRSA
jgi:HTH-type transcriptional regulator/antitoxin MqsA